ncbi:MAG: pectate lyase [Opitutaceae bacterium]|nr:pectate lyase [Verrucomicrobiales bacterium]
MKRSVTKKVVKVRQPQPDRRHPELECDVASSEAIHSMLAPCVVPFHVGQFTLPAVAARLLVWVVGIGSLAAILLATTGLAVEIPAFPGAEGFGRFASGGRGGDVYHVTNLKDSGPGSLREGFRSAVGPRTIVFDVSGIIELKSRLLLEKSSITIAGQTAPGDGITLKDYTFQIRNATNVIVRYLRCRLGDQNKVEGARGGDDTLNTEDVDRVVFDHCSLSWAIDGTHDLRRGGNFTLQWCILSEALNQSLHNKGEHAMCASYRDLSGNISLHHNLFSTCRDRHPTLGSAQAPPRYVIDFRNNVVYNWSAGGTANFADHFINCVNNLFRPGPMTDPSRLPIAMKGGLPDLAKGHMKGNVFEQREDLTRDNYIALDFQRWLTPPSKYLYRGTLADWRVDAEPVMGGSMPRTQSAEEAAELVLARAGASLHRDAVDRRIIDDVRNRRGRLINSQEEVGGWPALRSTHAPADQDRDGIPDAWERAHGLNLHDPADGKADRDGDGYTNLEEFLNSLCPQ